MPFYEYQCKACQHQLEMMQKMSDPALTICPHCQRPDLVKLVSSTAFQLKGEGWYVTDFKTKGAKPLDNKVEESSGSVVSTAATTTDSSATKTDSTSSEKK